MFISHHLERCCSLYSCTMTTEYFNLLRIYALVLTAKRNILSAWFAFVALIFLVLWFQQNYSTLYIEPSEYLLICTALNPSTSSNDQRQNSTKNPNFIWSNDKKDKKNKYYHVNLLQLCKGTFWVLVACTDFIHLLKSLIEPPNKTLSFSLGVLSNLMADEICVKPTEQLQND